MKSCKNGSVYSKLDLKCGYHQLELNGKAREITTFATHKGNFRYKRFSLDLLMDQKCTRKSCKRLSKDAKVSIISQMISLSMEARMRNMTSDWIKYSRDCRRRD